jgi:hypothetical protein
VTIREALHEIELWGAAAEFSLTSYDDCKGNKVALIKDWKDLLNKVFVGTCFPPPFFAKPAVPTMYIAACRLLLS